MTRIILPFIAFACMLSAGSAHHTECDDLHTESECKKVHGCKWKSDKGGGFCCGTPRARPDNASLTDVYVRLDADYGYEDTGDEVDNITAKDRLPAESEFWEDELPNNNDNDVYVSSGIESSPPRKGNLRAGESNGRFWELPFDNSSK